MWSGNVVFGWHGNTCYVFFIGAIFYMIYIVQVKSMCVPILRSIGSELTKLENMQQLYVLFDVTWRKNGTSYVMGTLLIGIWLFVILITRNIVKPSRSLYDFRFKSYGWNSGFRVFGDLDLWPLFYFFVTRIAHGVPGWCTGISMRSFIRIRPVWMGDICCG